MLKKGFFLQIPSSSPLLWGREGRRGGGRGEERWKEEEEGLGLGEWERKKRWRRGFSSFFFYFFGFQWGGGKWQGGEENKRLPSRASHTMDQPFLFHFFTVSTM